MSQNVPNLIVGGAPKCGTSSLYFWLSAHPDVYGSPKKETFFFADQVNRFNKEANAIEHGLQAYAQFFKGRKGERIVFEATAHYLYEERALAHFSSLENPPKVVFLFREPSKQMYSHYKMEKYRTKRTDLSLAEYVELPKIRNYVRYSAYVKRWLDAMPEDNVRCWTFEHLMSAKEEVLMEMAQWLGIDADFYQEFNFEHRNESVAIKSGALHQLGLKVQPLIPHWVQRAVLPIYMKLNSGGRVENDPRDRVILERFKGECEAESATLKQLFPKLRTDLWT